MMTDADIRTLNAELGFPEASADRWIHDSRADERREPKSLEATDEWDYRWPDVHGWVALQPHNR